MRGEKAWEAYQMQGLRKGLEYIPVVSDPGRELHMPEVQTGDTESTPCLDFLMSISGYMELMAAGAALLLVAQLVTAL